MIEIACLVAGIMFGMCLKQEISLSRYNKTYEQIDKEVRDQLNYYRNLTESLREDVRVLRLKIKVLDTK